MKSLIKKIIREDIFKPRNVEGRKEEFIKKVQNTINWDGDLTLKGLPIETLGKIQTVKGHLDIRDTQLNDLGDLKYVSGYVVIDDNIYDSLEVEIETLKTDRGLEYIVIND